MMVRFSVEGLGLWCTSEAVLAAMMASAALTGTLPTTTVVATSATYPSTCTPRSLPTHIPDQPHFPRQGSTPICNE